jgi:hypothetical protein
VSTLSFVDVEALGRFVILMVREDSDAWRSLEAVADPPTTRAAAETAVAHPAGETSRPQREGPDGSETPGTTKASSRS